LEVYVRNSKMYLTEHEIKRFYVSNTVHNINDILSGEDVSAQ
jgi:hypothetical protein